MKMGIADKDASAKGDMKGPKKVGASAKGVKMPKGANKGKMEMKGKGPKGA